MLELDTTIMTPAPVFETSGHVARFADWMVKDTKTGDVLRADHLVKNVLEARLAGDKEARGQAAQPQKEDDKKKKKKAAKSVAVKLEDAVAQKYETILAQVSNSPIELSFVQPKLIFHSSITSLAQNLVPSVTNMLSKTLTPITKLANRSNSISCLRVASVLPVSIPGTSNLNV